MVLSTRLVLVAAIIASRAAGAQVPTDLRPERGWLGFTIDSTSRVVIVRRVAAGSPAERGGLHRGDTITTIDKLTSRNAQLARIKEVEVGDRVVIEVRRGRQAPTTITLVAEPSSIALRQLLSHTARDSAFALLTQHNLDSVSFTLHLLLDSARLQAANHRLSFQLSDSALAFRYRSREWLAADSLFYSLKLTNDSLGSYWYQASGVGGVSGAELAPLETPLSDYLGVVGGLLVLRVTPRTAAARAGMKTGDVIVAVDGANIRTIAQLRRALQDRRTTSLDIVRNRVNLEVVLRPDTE